MQTVKVYRNGAMSLSKHHDALTAEWSAFDALKPHGRHGRLDSIYASPSLQGMLRWTNAAHSSQNIHVTEAKDLSNNEILVSNPENIYVYDVTIYEHCSQRLFLPTEFETSTSCLEQEEGIRSYWGSGIRLMEWEQAYSEKSLDPMDWEVLVPLEYVLSYRKIANRVLVDAAPEHAKNNFKKILNVS